MKKPITLKPFVKKLKPIPKNRTKNIKGGIIVSDLGGL